MILKYAIALAIVPLLAAFFAWAFLPATSPASHPPGGNSPPAAARNTSPGSKLFPHSPCSVVPVSQLACPCRRLTSLTWFRDKRQRGEGSPTAQAAGPLARRWRLSRHRN
jgi:hypothetical protein